ncbi:MAG: 1,6-anhydro-N-acetylmuramyl-L-alanine amidase AmpD [Pseudomonadota bacterium]
MRVVDHWLTDAKKVPSPNCDPRPPNTEISLIVIHCISLPPGEFGGDWIDKFFLNRLPSEAHPYFETIHRLKVSTHVVIRRTGEIIQYVPFNQRAWHAGESCYAEMTRCNDFSIGIELEGTVKIPYTNQQYCSLARLIGSLLQSSPALSPNRIAGHSEIAAGRKEDPGPSFDWPKLQALLKETISAPSIA